MSAALISCLLLLVSAMVRVPSDPGLYVVTAKGLEPVEGHAVTVERTASKLPPLPMKGALPMGGGSVKAELLGDHADEEVPSTPVFYYRVPDDREGEGPADLVLVKLKSRRGRRNFEISAGGSGSKSDWNPSAGISLKSQVRFLQKRVDHGVYRIVPADDLDPGEYGFYQYRGHDLPGLLYDFSVE